MRAKIKLWGNQYYLQTVTWDPEGKLMHVGFDDENNEYHTIFNTYESEKADRKHEVKSANLELRVFWEENL